MTAGSGLNPLIEAFRRNGRVNAALLDAVTEDDFGLSDGQGGLSVGQHLEHMVGMRKVHLERVGSSQVDQITFETEEADQQFWTVTLTVDQLRRAFAEADAALLMAADDAATGKETFSTYFASNPVHLLTLTLVHDAHHRGQITTLLRQGGRTEEQLSRLSGATWPIWRE